MEKYNNRHSKYMSNVISNTERYSLHSFHHIVNNFNTKIANSCKNHGTLCDFYTALCYKYQLKLSNSSAETDSKSPYFSESTFINIMNVLMLNDEPLTEELKNIILDIIVLQMALYCNVENFDKILRYLLNSKEMFENNNDTTKDLFFVLVDCLIDSLHLNADLKNQTLINNIHIMIINHMNSWFQTTEKLNWKLYVQILKKIINVFDKMLVLPVIWKIILNYKHDDWEKPLTLLCVIIDDILLCSSETVVALNIDNLNNQVKLWQLIIQGITSKVEQNHKQTLSILKAILNFVENHKMTPTEQKVVPFVYCSKYNQQPSLKELKNNFFLILESLEEKQAHLITPALEHLNDLIQFSSNHASCNNCLNKIWIALILGRLLDHKTNSIIKFGVMTLLKMNPKYYTDQLLALLVKGLNNTFLYSNSTLNPNLPIVNKLSELFLSAEHNGVDLINRFICEASKITWASIPLYYTIFSLRKTATKLPVYQHNILTNKELQCIIEIMEKTSKIHSSEFRYVLYQSFYSTFIISAIKPLDLELLASFSYFFTNCLKPHLRGLIYYISKNISKDDVNKYISDNYEKISSSQLINEPDIQKFAAMLVYLYDAQLILDSKSDKNRDIVNNVFKLIIDADVRPYLNKNQSSNVIQLINHLIIIVQKYCSNERQKFDNLIIPYLECVKKLILKNLRHNVKLQSFRITDIYTECFNTIIKYYKYTQYSDNNIYKTLGEEAFNLISKYDDLGEFKNIKYWYGLKIAVLCTEFAETTNNETQLSNVIDFFKGVSLKKLNTSENFNDNCNNGKIISDCYKLTAELFEKFMKSYYRRMKEELPLLILKMKEFIEIGQEFVIIPIINVLALLLKEKYNAMCTFINESNVINSIIDSAFIYLWDLDRDQLYWINFDRLLRFILNDDFFRIEKCKAITLKHMENVISESHRIIKIKDLLLLVIQDNPLTLVHYFQTLISNFLDANLGDNDNKIKMQTYNHMTCQYSTCIFENDYVDVQFRTKSILTFIKLLKTETNYVTFQNILTYLISILKKYENKRYFENSHIHRIKHRVMQLLLLLYPFLRTEEKKVLHDFSGNSLIFESNQPTVRIMQEWLLIKLYLDETEMHPFVWQLLEKGKYVRPGSITSLASIIYHVCCRLPAHQQQIFVETAISKLLSSCLSQKFVVRCYCQVVLAKIIDLLSQQFSSENYKIIRDAIKESMTYGNLRENSLKMSEEFYFTSFDPVNDYTIETIFYELPRLLHMTIEECIPLKIFNYYNFENITIPKNNTDSRLPLLNPTSYVPRNQVEGSEELTEHDVITDDNNSKSIQKKITLWKSMIPVDDELSRVSTIKQQKFTDGTGLIVVASLIDKMPNLGGLARSAEIFCAKELVLGSLRYVENREFQALSVSADKWIQVTEVKAHELQDYLLEKHSMGWTLVGAEQTTNSINLLEMKFDKKTVLILGNEKSGIPANLIPLLDVCVEIPQAGVVRSLNVHVTGAICMWQYAQQHIF